MLTELDLELPEVAQELIDEYGKEITYSFLGESVYDILTATTIVPKTSKTIKAVVEDQGQNVEGSVEGADKKLTIGTANLPTVPTSGDQFFFDGMGFVAGKVNSIYSGELVACYEIYGSFTGASDGVTFVELVGRVNASGTLTAVLKQRYNFVGAVAGAATVIGAVSVTVKLAGSGAGSGTLAGALRVRTRLVGSVTGAGALTGALRFASGLHGDVTASSSLAGTMRVRVSIAGAVQGTGTVSGTLRARARLVGSVAGAAIVSGTLRAGSGLSGAVAGAAMVIGALSTRARLIGTVAAAGVTSGTLKITTKLVGAVYGLGAATGNLTNASGEDADTTALVARMTVPPDSTRRTLINNLIVGLKADGVWTKMDWFGVLAAHDEQAGRLNWKPGSDILTPVGTPAFAVNKGFYNTDTVSYLDTGKLFQYAESQFNPVGTPGGYSNHIGAWCSNLTKTVAYVMGKSNATLNRLGFRTDGLTSSLTTGSSAGTTMPGIANWRYGVSTRRVADDAVNNNFYDNGSFVQAINLPNSSGSATGTAQVLAYNNISVVANLIVSVVHWGAGLTTVEVAALYSRLNTYMTAIGAVTTEDNDAVQAMGRMNVPPPIARRPLINDLIVGLKADGVWSRLDWFNIFAAHTEQAALANWRHATKTFGATNSPAFTIDRGYYGNGAATSCRLDMGEFYQATGNQFSLNDASMGVWAHKDYPTSLNMMGNSGGVVNLLRFASGNASSGTVNGGNAVVSGVVDASSKGFLQASRLDAATLAVMYNDNPAAVGSTTDPAVRTNNGTILQGSSYGVGMACASYSGASLTTTQQTAMFNRVNTYLTAIGAN